jgi:hypothetical protein
MRNSGYGREYGGVTILKPGVQGSLEASSITHPANRFYSFNTP